MYLYNSPFIRGISYINSFDNLELSDTVVQSFKVELLQKTLQFDNIKLRNLRISIISLVVTFTTMLILYKVVGFNLLVSAVPIVSACIVLHLIIGIIEGRHTKNIKQDLLIYKRAKRLYRMFHTYHFDDYDIVNDDYYRKLEHADFVNTNDQY